MQNRNKWVSHEGLFSVQKELALTQNLGSWLTLVLLQPWPCPHLRLCESQCNRSTQQRPHTFLKHCEDLPASESRNGGVQHSSLKSLLPRPPNHPLRQVRYFGYSSIHRWTTRGVSVRKERPRGQQAPGVGATQREKVSRQANLPVARWWPCFGIRGRRVPNSTGIS